MRRESFREFFTQRVNPCKAINSQNLWPTGFLRNIAQGARELGDSPDLSLCCQDLAKASLPFRMMNQFDKSMLGQEETFAEATPKGDLGMQLV